eukprot:scaffold45750_cov29-Cyclotella_meneghiniana.AAC.1
MLENNTPHEVINWSASVCTSLCTICRPEGAAQEGDEEIRKSWMQEHQRGASTCASYLNSHDDWERKLKDPTKVYNLSTKWSTDMNGASMMTEGYKVYNVLVKWCSKLKGMSKTSDGAYHMRMVTWRITVQSATAQY